MEDRNPWKTFSTTSDENERTGLEVFRSNIILALKLLLMEEFNERFSTWHMIHVVCTCPYVNIQCLLCLMINGIYN